ncbi:MAG: T9SS type A sorting domain-containing protein [Sphingobacteriaceae bacterium]|nr:T9SS type A sorting domain-containing protein [Sphingobacteriaceae bacterium]
MKKLLFAAVLLLSTWSAQAQIILLSNDTVYTAGPATEFEIIAYANVRNTNESPKVFRWVKLQNQVTPGWLSTICDVNLCYPDGVDSADFTLGGNAIGNVDGHFYPNNIVGTGIMRVRVYEIANPSNNVVVTFIGSTTGASVAAMSKPSLKVYPVPTDHYLYLETTPAFELAEIEIYNMIGKKVAQYKNSTMKSRISVGHLPKGQYIIRMNNGQDVLTKYFTKN